MSMTFTKSTLSIAIALTIAACGGTAGLDLAQGIGGSGYVSSGSVTGFGSVFVNGVEYDTSSTSFDIDDSGSGSQDDLAIGMVVTVTGTVNADGVTGTATSISFDDQLQGPISAVSAVDLDGENRTITVLGKTVRISAINTVFDISSTCTACSPFDFDNIFEGNNVEISGFFNAAGELVATRVELKAAAFSTSNIVELKGTITGPVVNSQFTVNSVNVDASSAQLVDLPNGELADNILVEVKGTCSDAACSTLNATRVEGQSGFDDADKISVEGLVTDFGYNGTNTFKINGVSVDASSASLEPTTLVLRDGARVEVEGPISNNIIKAIKVELRGGSARVHASVASVDASTGNFVVSFTGAASTPQSIAVTVTTATEMEGTVTNGSFVRVRGFENEGGGITANQVEVRDTPDDIIVQGNITSNDFIPNTSITVLGVTFDVSTNGGETEFQDIDNIQINSQTVFKAALVGTQLVKVKDKEGSSNMPPNGIADEIELETD